MTVSASDTSNSVEIAYWNGAGGRRWLDRQQVHDALLAPVSEVLLVRAAASAGEFVLDVGCGCGGTSIALARCVVPTGRVVGIDVSLPMLERARRLAAADLFIDFVLADATVFAFEPARADLLFSRFGVMFFADPVKSFANLRTGLRHGARVVFACWREPRMNSWAMLPLQEAYRHVDRLPDVGPEDPGPFSFASERRVISILEQAGFGDVACEAIDLAFDLANGRGLDAAVDTALNIGPTSRALEGKPESLRAAAAASIRTALARYQVGDAVPLPGAIWLVTASNL